MNQFFFSPVLNVAHSQLFVSQKLFNCEILVAKWRHVGVKWLLWFWKQKPVQVVLQPTFPSLSSSCWLEKTFYTNKLKKHQGNQCTFLHGGFKIAFSFKTYFHCLLLVLLLAACEHSLDFSSIIAWVICKGDIKNCIFLVFVGPSGGWK